MKKIRIFAFPSHGNKERVSGVDFARIIQPMEALNGYKNDKYEFQVEVYDPKTASDKMSWVEISARTDILYLNYTALPWEFAHMGLMMRKAGVPMVLDLDDNLWNVMPDNQAYESYKKGADGIRNFTAICNEVDYVTTTNRYLKNVIAFNSTKEHNKIKVFPNYVNLYLYNHKPEFKDTNDITLLHFGSTTHFIDLQEQEFENGIDMIMKEYPNVRLMTIGAMIPKYKKKWGLRYESGYGDTDVYKWIKDKFPSFMDRCDIFVTPLHNNAYTKCKSSIKFLEASSTGKVGVWQRIRQYEEVIDGKNGLLASTADEWYLAIKKLIDDKVLRKQMGEKAFEDVKASWQVKQHINDYADYFSEIFESYKP